MILKDAVRLAHSKAMEVYDQGNGIYRLEWSGEELGSIEPIAGCNNQFRIEYDSLRLNELRKN